MHNYAKHQTLDLFEWQGKYTHPCWLPEKKEKQHCRVEIRPQSGRVTQRSRQEGRRMYGMNFRSRYVLRQL